MQSDLFDKKVREAADHHHPAYDENAWKKMQKLLDRHMPVEEDRRRGLIFWIPLFLLLGGGAWLFISQPWNQKDSRIAAEKERVNTVSEKTVPVNDNKTAVIPGEALPEVNSISDPKVPSVSNESISKVQNDFLKLRPKSRPVNNMIDDSRDRVPVTKNENITGKEPEPLTDRIINPEKPVIAQADVKAKEVNKPEEKKSEVKQTEEKVSDEKIKTADTQKNKNKKPQTLASRFFFFASSGPDISFTSHNEAGKIELMAGIGAGFQLNDRLVVRSGFFTGRKVYSAKPEDYDPPSQFWNYYPNMQKIDADCKVYEVPLLVSYQFGKSTKKSWIATAGLSSYFMMEEKYKYYYKPTPTSPTYSRNYTVKNRFEHHFSVLTISGGYKHKIGKRVTVMAEPYFKLPLDGIGFGKVKLNSGGVMFSVGIHPFGK